MGNLIVQKTEKLNHWGKIDLTVLEDPNLTGTAKAIHTYALTRPNGWKFNMTDLLNRFHERSNAILAAFACLEKNGYMKREQLRDENGMMLGVQFNFHEEPLPVSERAQPQQRRRQSKPLAENRVTDFPLVDLPLPDEPLAGQPLAENRVTLVYTTEEGTTDKKEPQKKGPSGKAQTSLPEGPSGCAWCLRPLADTQGVRYLMQQIHDRYRKRFGECPTLVAGRDGARLKALNKTDDLVLATYGKYLATDDDWYVKHGYDVPTFCTQFDGIRRREGGQHGRIESGTGVGTRSGRPDGGYGAVLQRRAVGKSPAEGM